jgi:O-antigen ligase
MDASDFNQLTVILILATLLFIIASALPQKVATTVLLVLIPIQVIETRFGTSSVALAYVVFIAMLLRKEPVRLPMLPQIAFLLLWYLVATSISNPPYYVQHAVYVFVLVSAFLVFWLSYDLMDRFEDPRTVINFVILMNVLVVGYCIFQLYLGPGTRFVFFGIDELNMTMVRADGRLTGPFQSAEITAQFFVIMIFVVLLQFWHAENRNYRRVLSVLAMLNFACLVATGSRGEFLILVGCAAIYLWLFRSRLGTFRAIRLAISGAAVLAVTALIVINFTQFGGLFDRLEDTEFGESGIPDTRQVLWPPAWEEIQKRPMLGHGPRFRFFLEEMGVRYPGREYIRYPHSLYLFLLYTVGFPGLLLFLYFFVSILIRCARATTRTNAPPYLADLARTGVLVMLIFLIDGIKMEQMRLSLSDFWHFIFALSGVFVAACAKIERQTESTQNSAVRRRSRGLQNPHASRTKRHEH